VVAGEIRVTISCASGATRSQIYVPGAEVIEILFGDPGAFLTRLT